MNIYQSVTHFIQENQLFEVYPNNREYVLKNSNPELYNQIISHTNFLVKAPFRERLYCFVHGIGSRPVCALGGCDKNVRFSTSVSSEGYYRYCSQRCSLKDMKTLLGVENASQLESVKEKKRQSSLEKYGVDSPAQTEEVKNRISLANRKRWQKKFDELAILCREKPTMTKKEYYRFVQRLTDHTYRLNIDTLDPQRLRGKGYHIDHKVSRCFGYHNNISPVDIAKLENLVLLPGSENMSKGMNNSQDPSLIVENQIGIFTTPKKYPHVHIATPVCGGSSLCVYCGIHPARFLIGLKQKPCCQLRSNSCPAVRKKNSVGQEKRKH